MFLRIDTTKSDVASLTISVQKTTITRDFNNQLSLLPLIVDTFENQLVDLASIDSIAVNPGPGTHFSRTRSGVVVANAIGFGLNVAVNHKPFETPKYNQPPNITKK